MFSDKALYSIEYDKILNKISDYAVTDGGKQVVLENLPCINYDDAYNLLKKTEESYNSLYVHGVSSIIYFPEVKEFLSRAKKGGSLSMGELLSVSELLKSGRILSSEILDIKDENIVFLKQICGSIFNDYYLENEITTKIISSEEMSDSASEKLFELRKTIKALNNDIRERLSKYVKNESGFLQENIYTVRNGRYVIPVRNEHKNHVRGLIHDQSTSGSTIYIEPEDVLQLGNNLKSAILSEQAEIERILADLSNSVGQIADKLETNMSHIYNVDSYFAKAIYSYKTKAVKPILKSNGVVNIINGKHPLIDVKKVIPVSVSLGDKFNFLLISGPNTGGKTVTLKMVGLFVAMASSGIYIQASESSEISVFSKIFCDVGDEQSIENSLSTFSSHIKNIIDIVENANNKSLVLVDEIGAGTDPEEGSSLAQAVIEELLNRNCFGIITTHYTALKEFAYNEKRIENACMVFDSNTNAPLYKINIGVPGSSNALKIAKRLGLSNQIIENATKLLSDDKRSFEKILNEAENSKQEAERLKNEILKEKIKIDEELQLIKKEREKFEKERDNFYAKAKIESRRVVNQKLEEAEDLVEQIRVLFDKEELTGKDLIDARTLKNRLEDKKFSLDEEQNAIVNYELIDANKVKVGDSVYYKKTDTVCVINGIGRQGKECEISFGNVRMKVKTNELYYVPKVQEKPKQTVSFKRENATSATLEVNVIGMNVPEALDNVEKLLDQAIINSLKEVKIIHGVGMKILSKNIHDYLKRNKNVETFRFGKYGEGERGVTFVTLK